MYKVILIVFIIHLSSIGSLIGQSKLNIIDSKGQKTGLWAVRINNVTKKIENYSSGIPDGFFIEFSDSGEIVNYRLYDYGVLVDASVLYTDTVFGDRIDKSLEKFTGVTRCHPSKDSC